ncbi:related to ALG12-alpha-1,6-mannosyltransferase [Sporisorium reilianum f. sp. reilianum]|uniref:Mannosyltransferase n=1 Tax=Sporisorium reilianum f. sp. reilianum TaxID=72559 RepID=A0A2N8U6V2_9BASI|nr:related to ALG12-alpha-1,6-mannosyltransferase [Sporisorium reilianum f. sp. reilianum]
MDRANNFIWLCGLPCLLVLVAWRTVSCPYTKVEESFTIQAVHDILSYGVGPEALTRYDHQVFPGAVPRSFIGPLLLAAVSYPFILFSRFVGAVETSADVQVIVRLCLAATNVAALAFFCQQCFGPSTKSLKPKGTSRPVDERLQAGLFLLISAAQFHFAFWTSRTIPNSLSLPFVITALALVCRNIGTADTSKRRTLVDAQAAIWLLTFSAVVLRLEIVATLIPVGLFLLHGGKLSLWKGLKTGIIASACSVFVTSAIDTYFWQDLTESKARGIFRVLASSLQNLATGDQPRPLWPELHALLFNVVEGKSSEWGVSPWHAYVTSLIPKLLAFTAPLVVIGSLKLLKGRSTAVEARASFLLLTAVTHITVLSMLGHKEWRFAFYIVPALNVVAAIGADVLARSWSGKAVLAALFTLQVGLSWFTGHLSSINYPGGEALAILHQQLQSDPNATARGPTIVHIDVLAAMTGVTLFGSIHLDRIRSSGLLDLFSGVVPASCPSEQQCWVYDKTEHLPISGHDAARAWSAFTHLLTEVPECRILRSQAGARVAEADQPFEPLAPPVSSFSGLQRKTVAQTKADLLSLPKALLGPQRRDIGSLVQLALPVVIVEKPAVWLCRRKKALTSQ